MYGLGNKLLRWFENYLPDRKQVYGVLLSSRVTKCGVPQRSLLGPLLFIIYVNDMIKYLPDCNINLNADDTALHVGSPSYLDLMLTLRIEIATLKELLLANKLSLNVRKTKQ